MTTTTIDSVVSIARAIGIASHSGERMDDAMLCTLLIKTEKEL